MRCETIDRDTLLSLKTTESILEPENGVIYWYIENFTPDMEKYKVILAFEQCFQYWSPYFHPITFKSTSNPAQSHITIKFANNGDPDLEELFGATTLAYAFLPTGTELDGHMRFNDEKEWADMHKPTHFSLSKVAAHEVGHSLGLYHSHSVKDIMYAQYVGGGTVFFSDDTIEAIDRLYGKEKQKIQPSYKLKCRSSKFNLLKKIKRIFSRQGLLKLKGKIATKAINAYLKKLIGKIYPFLIIISGVGLLLSDVENITNFKIDMYGLFLVILGTEEFLRRNVKF